MNEQTWTPAPAQPGRKLGWPVRIALGLSFAVIALCAWYFVSASIVLRAARGKAAAVSASQAQSAGKEDTRSRK